MLQVKFLKSVPLLANLPPDLLARMSDVLEMEIFKVRIEQERWRLCKTSGVWSRLRAIGRDWGVIRQGWSLFGRSGGVWTELVHGVLNGLLAFGQH